MAAINSSLFSWDNIDALSDLKRFELVIKYMPDDKLIQALWQQRKNGRNDYPIEAMWHAVLAGIVFQHHSIESLIRELNRNPTLLSACGFNPLPAQKKPEAKVITDSETGKKIIAHPKPEEPYYKIPNRWNFSRFIQQLVKLEEQQQLISEMVITLREKLMEALPDFGKHLGYDGKAIHSYSTGSKNEKTNQTSDPGADWGKHKTQGVDKKTGKSWEKIKSWFGFNLHLIADSLYEIPVGFHLTPASYSEQKELPAMISELFEQTPELSNRCDDFCADRGLDCGGTKALLWDKYEIKPLIDTRLLWRAEKEEPNYDSDRPITRSLYPERCDTIIYNEKGRVRCVCPLSGNIRDMTFQGFEKDRKALKYRCPAMANNLTCEGQKKCHHFGGINSTNYGRVIRIYLEQNDRRIFTPTPHGTASWNRGYNRRSALERINNRIDNSFCFERHFIRGLQKMRARAGLAIVVMMSMALGHVEEGRTEQMRSLVKPVLNAA